MKEVSNDANQASSPRRFNGLQGYLRMKVR